MIENIKYLGLVFLLSHCAVQAKTTNIRIRKENINLEKGIGQVRVEFESSARVAATWCQKPLAPAFPGQCKSLQGNANFKIHGDISLFYFSYLGSMTINAQKEPLTSLTLRFVSQPKNVIFDYDIIDQGDINPSMSQFPEMLQVLPPVISADATMLTCGVQSKREMLVTWYLTTNNITVTLFEKVQLQEEKTTADEMFRVKNEAKLSMYGHQTIVKSTLFIAHHLSPSDTVICSFTEETKKSVSVYVSTTVKL